MSLVYVILAYILINAKVMDLEGKVLTSVVFVVRSYIHS